MKRIYALCTALIITSFNLSAQTYCTTGLYTTGCTVGDNLDNVTLNNIVQVATGCSTGGYGDYTTDTVQIQQTAQLVLSVTSGYSGQWYAIWIDGNDDGDFDDSGEHLWSASQAGPSANVVYAENIVIPTTVSQGAHRMRLRCKWSGTALLATESCSSFTYGEVHDYTVYVGAPPVCPQPYYLTSGAKTDTSLSFSYTSTDSIFEIEYGPTGFTQGTGTTVTVTSTNPTISGLNSNSCYEFYVRANCSSAGNGYSLWNGPIEICTPCVTQSLPMSEDFTVWPPNCFILTGGSSLWDQDANAAHADMSSSFGSNETRYLTTAPVSLNSLARVKFKWSHALTSNPSRLALVARVAGSSSWDTLWDVQGSAFDSQDGAAFNAPGTYKSEMLNLDSLIYYGVSAEFRFVGSSSYGPDAWLDDLVIEQQPLCPEPTSLGVSSISDTSASTTWNSAGSNFVVQWGPVGFTVGTGNLDTVNSSNHVISGLSANQSYEYYVMRNCTGQGNGTSTWTGPYVFTTLCSPFTASLGYYEDWDSYSDGDSPACWTITGSGFGFTAEVQLPSTFQTAAYTTPNYISIYNSSATNVTFVSPLLSDLQQNNSQIRMRLAKSSSFSQSKLIVGTMSSPGLQSSFIPVDTIDLTTNFDEYTVAFPAVNAGHSHVALRLSQSQYYYVYLDDFIFETQPTCLPAQNISAAPGATTAAIAWTHGDPLTTGSYVAWGPSGFNPGTGSVSNSVLVTGNTYSITGLTPSTSYTVWVADSCGIGNIGPWQGPVSFTTACLAATLPYSEDFNATSLACWDPSGGTRQFASYPMASGGNSMRGNYWGWTNGNYALLTSRPITISALAQVSFDWSHSGQYIGSYPNDQLLLLARPVSATSWDTIVNLIGTNFSSPGAGTTIPGTFINELQYLPGSYIGTDVVFQIVGNSGYGPDVFFDNFFVEAVPSCPDPTPSSGSVSASTADISWTSASPPQGSSVMWGPAGFYTGTGSITGTVAHNVTSTHTISGLSGNTAYEVYVRDSCGPTDLSGWAGPVTIQTLCSIFSMPYSENFDAVPLTCWTPSGSRQFTSYSVGSGYAMRGNFWSWSSGTAELTSPPVTISSAAQVSFDWSHQYNSSYSNDQLVLLVRETTSSSWDTLISLVGQSFDSPGSGTTSPGTFVSEFISLPSSFVGKDVVFRFDGTSGYGPDVFFDNFLVDGLCAVPTNVSVSAPGCAHATVTWTPGAQAIVSILEYGPAGFTLGQGISVNNMSLSSSGMIILTSLNSGTAYDVYVRDSCPGALTSWSTPAMFTTANSPKPSLSPSYTVIYTNPVTMFFTSGATGQDSTGWYFSDGTTDMGDTVTHVFATNGPGTAIVFAQNECGIITDTLNFVVGLDDINLTNLRLYPNPTSSEFYLEFQLPSSKEVHFRVITLTGTVVIESREYLQKGLVRKSFDLGTSPAGVYLMEIKTDFGIIIKRVVIDN
tara:strand:+ start:2516 stop:6877 length:4362 start_codon:yes stop_codon:yes gene_type:complete